MREWFTKDPKLFQDMFGFPIGALKSGLQVRRCAVAATLWVSPVLWGLFCGEAAPAVRQLLPTRTA